MAINVKNIAMDEAKLMVSFGGEEAKVVYRPSVLTHKNMKAAEKAQSTGDLEYFFEFLVKLIQEWDIVDESGDQIPVSTDVIDELPIFFIGRIFADIMKDAENLGDAPKAWNAG